VSDAAHAEAERRYPFSKRDTASNQGHRIGFKEGAEWADHQRELLADATRERLADLLIDHTRLRGISGDCSCGHVVPLGHSFAAHQADAIVAQFRPVATTSERLVEAIGRDWFPGNWDALRVGSDEAEAVASTVVGILASGAVRLPAEVEATALEAAAAEVERPSWHPLARLNDTEHRTMHRIREWLLERAQGIREGRS
jgi:hypothetical protein